MISTACVAPPDVVRRNCKAAASRGLPWLAAQPETPRPLAVVGGGASSGTHLHEILAFPGAVMAINGAYDWLQDNGRIADYVLGLDPGAALADFYRRACQDTQFIIADCCDPTVFDALAGYDVVLYHARQGDELAQPGDIPAGPSAMTRAPLVGAVLGHRDVTLYGADSCFSGPATHVYGGSTPVSTIRVECAGSWLTTLTLLAQAEYLAAMIPATGALRVRLAGDHLASAMLDNPWRIA